MKKVTLTLAFFRKADWSQHSLAPMWEFESIERCLEFIANVDSHVERLFVHSSSVADVEVCWTIERSL